MTSLRELQSSFKAHLLEGDSAITQTVRSESAGDGFERLGIYGFGYGQRLRDALRIEFPGLAALTGADAFDGLLDRYIKACPSQHPNVRWLGRGMADWLDDAGDYAARPEFAAMARLDWGLSTSFDAPDASCIGVDALASLQPAQWPDLRFRLHPSVQTMPLHWNVDAIRSSLADDAVAAPAVESVDNAVVAIWRKDFGVRFRRLDVDEAAALDAVQSGATFGEVCELLCQWHADDAVATRAVYLLQRWIAADWIAALDHGDES